MNTEKKARAYDEALERAKQVLSNNCTEVEKLCQWKPSEEQIKWLKDVIETVPMTCRQQVPLESLYEQLKKLM